LTLAYLFPENTGAFGVISFGWTIGLLVAYLIFSLRIPAMALNPKSETAFKEGASMGALIGASWSIHVTTEHFLVLPGNWNGYLTLTFMGLNFSLFGATAFRCMHKTNSLGASLIGAMWCAMVSILILFSYVYVMEYLFIEHIEENLLSAFKASGMKDMRSYVVHNIFESAGTHLLEAPIISIVFGLLGIFIYKLKITFFK